MAYMPLPATDRAWMAGLFEGEGSMHFRGSVGKRGGNAQLRLAMTDADVVEKFAALAGCGNLYWRHDKRPNHKPVRTWTCYVAADILILLTALAPLFGIRRSAKAAETISFAEQIDVHKGEKTHCPQGHPYSGENLIREKISRRTAKGERREYVVRRCRTCRREQARNRAAAS